MKCYEEKKEKIYSLFLAKSYHEALAVIEELEKLDFRDDELLFLKASAYIELEDKEKAMLFAGNLVEANINDSYAQYLFLRARFLNGEYDLVNEIKNILTFKMKNEFKEKLYNLLGQCERFLGNGKLAALCYKKASKYAMTNELRALNYSNYLFNLHYDNNLSLKELKKEAVGYDEFFRETKTFLHRQRRERKKLRIGYISPDIRKHVVLNFSYALFKYYDKENFEVYCYSLSGEDGYSRKIMEMVDGWRNLTGHSTEVSASLIYDDDIDILFDLSGHTRGNALPILAYKPAPIIISGIGFFASTGLSTVDYVLSDRYLANIESTGTTIVKSEEFVEKLLVLGHSHFSYMPFGNDLEVSSAPCQKNGYVTFGSFNSFTKVTDEVLSVWGEILKRVPNARLFLKSEIFSDEKGTEAVCMRLRKLGFDLSRVKFQGTSSDYLEKYAEIDIALDTFPYNGGGTTMDALYMGVPVLILAGKSQGARFGYSILMNLGLEELCTYSKQEYIERAVLLANEKEILISLRMAMRSLLKSSPLMNPRGYLKEIEDGYRLIFDEYQKTNCPPSLKEIPVLLQSMKQSFSKYNVKRVLAIADKILSCNFLDRYSLLTLAEVYIDLKDEKNAEKAIGKLAEKYPEDGYVMFLLSRVKLLKKDFLDAERLAKAALKTNSLEKNNRSIVYNTLAKILREEAKTKEAAEVYFQAIEATDDVLGKCRAYSNYLLGVQNIEHDGKVLKNIGEKAGALLKNVKRYSHTVRKREKIRIGYISPDFRMHVVSCFSIAFFRSYDKSRFEVYGYHAGNYDYVTSKFEALADKWRDISKLKDEEAARLIYEDEIDILVDLAGHTAGNRLSVLAYKPAPIIVSGIGFMSTTGIEQIDYFLGDKYIDEGNEDENFTEKIIRLRHSHFCYQPVKEMKLITKSSFRKTGYITLGSLNNFNKVTHEVIETWAKILDRIKNARLFLKTAVFDNEDSLERIKKEIEYVGIDLSRVDFEGYSIEYLDAYRKIDIALDTFPYPGGGTTCDALYMGVPVVTLKGTRHGARFGYSILKNMELDELIAETKEEYIEKVVALAEDKEKLNELHLTLRRRMKMSPVMDEVVYMNDLEDEYERIYCNYAGIEEDKDYFKLTNKAYKEKNSRAMIRFGKKFLLEREKVEVFFAVGKGYADLSRHIEAMYYYQKGFDWLKKQENLEGLSEIAYTITNCLGHQKFLLGNSEASELFFLASELAESVKKDRARMLSSYLLTLHNTFLSKEEIFSEHERYGELYSFKNKAEKKRYNHKKIRIGIFSADFRNHVMASFYMPLLRFFDRERFEVYAYSLFPKEKEDDCTRLVKSLVTGYRAVGKDSDQELSEKIIGDEIDVIIDFGGHSAENRLGVLARKLVSLQISGIGYMNTTGLKAVDYLLVDNETLPVENEQYITEKPLRLTSLFCYDGKKDAPPVEQRKEKKNGEILFGVFNQYRKINDEMLVIWLEIMKRVPNSRILLKSQIFYDERTVALAYERLKEFGFSMEKILFEPATSDYLWRYLDVDIALDTYPYPGGGTTCDALYMGVPVVTLYGDRFGSRFGKSILSACGIGELAVSTGEEYIEKAVALAKDKELLGYLHKNLRAIMEKSPLMQGKEYTREIENFILKEFSSL